MTPIISAGPLIVMDDSSYYLDIVKAAQTIQAHIQGMDKEAFRASLLHQDAVIRQIMVIGEAARQVSEDGRNTTPAIPWSQIIKTRNHLVHRYFRIDFDIVWGIVESDLDLLIKVLSPLIPPPPNEST
jgi:uncharacterized protein with HEPN domain